MLFLQIENTVEGYSSDDSETMMKSELGGNPRKHHRLWSVSEVKKLIDGVAHFGVGKWTHIKKLLFSTSVHRTPVDLKVYIYVYIYISFIIPYTFTYN